MEPKDVLKLVAKDIKDLESTVYHFEEILRPRIEADKKVLDNLRTKYTKLSVLVEKLKNKEQVSAEEIKEAVPTSLQQ